MGSLDLDAARPQAVDGTLGGRVTYDAVLRLTKTDGPDGWLCR